MAEGFPDDFWWGTGASSTQCEGAAPAGTWYRFEQEGKVPVSGDGNGFGTRYAEDFGLFAERGLTHHRMSVEWARIEPQEGRRDDAEVERYRNIAIAAREAGISLWVCLHHFSLPTWFVDDHGGLLDDAARTTYWRRHVEFMAEMFGDLVFGWKPVNEPMAYAICGWLLGVMPPERRNREEFAVALRAAHLASYEAALVLRQTGKPVASVQNLAPTYPADDSPETAVAVQSADDITFGCWLSAEREGVLRVPLVDPVENPDFGTAFDLIGFSNYNAQAIGAASGMRPYPPDGDVGPLGYVPGSDGLAAVIDRLHAELPGRPLLVSEHGVGTADDAQRYAIIERSVGLVGERVAAGVPVKGFFHWTGVDNYEWNYGYDVAFGLFDRDRQPRRTADLMTRFAAGEQSWQA